ncbi:TPA: 50S ribosomal protein L34e [Candidatus Woesearchaeota archaeon]|nr:50S ribosomal protein L34e [Candidatus Woesearchaeota archaeon]
MTYGRFKSRTFRRLKVKTPGAKTVLHYGRRKPKAASCSECGQILKAVPRGLPFQMRALPKTKKRPERPFGGNLCSKCMRRLFVAKARIVQQ